jgi:hypothetical protein
VLLFGLVLMVGGIGVLVGFRDELRISRHELRRPLPRLAAWLRAAPFAARFGWATLAVRLGRPASAAGRLRRPASAAGRLRRSPLVARVVRIPLIARVRRAPVAAWVRRAPIVARLRRAAFAAGVGRGGARAIGRATVPAGSLIRPPAGRLSNRPRPTGRATPPASSMKRDQRRQR